MKQMFGAIILAGALAAGVSADAKWDIEKSFSSGAGKTLSINLRSGGDIRVVGVPGDKVNVKVRLTGRDAEDIDVDVQETAGGVEIRSEYNGHRNSVNAGTDVDVEVPSNYNVDLESMGGDIIISNVEGEFEGQTMGGDLDLQNLKGRASLTTMGGDIEVSKSDLEGKVKTMGGDVTLRDVSGSLDGSTMGGDVIQEQSSSTTPSTRSGEKKIHSMGGDLNIDNAPEGATLETMGGDITIRSAKDHVQAKTMGGDIRVDALDGRAKLTTMGGDVEMNMVGDGSQPQKDVEITSMGGDIQISLPANMSASFNLEIEYDNDHERAPKIVSDFPVQITESEGCDSDRDHGGRRSCRTIHGSGSAGAGTNRVKIRTFDGDIIIKRS